MAQESKNENRKQRIREAFHDGKQVERMPAREDMAPQHSDDVIYRVAPYCRVSTMSEMQAESFEIQQLGKIRIMHNDYTMIPHEASVAAEKDMIRRMHRQAEIAEALGLLDDAPNQKNGDDIS